MLGGGWMTLVICQSNRVWLARVYLGSGFYSGMGLFFFLFVKVGFARRGCVGASKEPRVFLLTFVSLSSMNFVIIGS